GNVTAFINEYIKNYKIMEEEKDFFTSDIYYMNDSLSLHFNIKILDLLTLEDWGILCKYYHINFNQINVLDSYLKFIYDRSPNILKLECKKEKEKLEQDFMETVSFLKNTFTNGNLTESQNNDISKRLQEKGNLSTNVSDTYLIKAKNSKIYAEKVLVIINDLNILLNKDILQ
ncbi:MAG: hypothetical protein ACRCVU_01340, partial [Flavobacterium sp.]